MSLPLVDLPAINSLGILQYDSRWRLVFLLHSFHLHAKSSCLELERQTLSVASTGGSRAPHSGKGLSLATLNAQPELHHMTKM